MARWRAAKEAESGEKDRRPYLASECTDLSKCEKYRLEIIREISKKVAQIQNGNFSVFRILDEHFCIIYLFDKLYYFSWIRRISYS